MRRITAFVLIIMGISISCIDDIEIQLPENAEELMVIEGYVEKADPDYIFYGFAAKSNALDEFIVDRRVEADIVVVMDENKTLTLINGQKFRIPIQEYHDGFGGDPVNSKFKLLVTTSAGEVYESEEMKILEVPEPKALNPRLTEREVVNSAGNIVKNNYVELLVTSPVVNTRGERVSLRWDVTGVNAYVERMCDPLVPARTCYVQDSAAIFRVNMLNANVVGGDTLKDYVIDVTVADYRFASGYYYTVVQKSLTNQAAAFWEQIRDSNPPVQNIFAVTPGSIVSNIRNVARSDEKVLGFFYTSAVDTIRLGVKPGEAGRPLSRCIATPDIPECCDCIILRQSTRVRPEYWIF